MTNKEKLEKLERENSELLEYKVKNESRKRRKQSAFNYFLKKLFNLFFGDKLNKTIKVVVKRFNDERRIDSEEVSNLFYSLFSRLIRVRAIYVIIALFPTILILLELREFKRQNTLISLQNKTLKEQSLLIESSRRSSQVFIMGDVLRDINMELREIEKEQKKLNLLKDTVLLRKLSPGLAGRIISLSLAMRPYKYIESENNTGLSKPLSPERGQLLIALMNSDIDNEWMRKNIFDWGKPNFSYSDLKNAPLRDIKVSWLNLENSDLRKANFSYSSIGNINLMNADLRGANFKETSMQGANLKHANIKGVDFTGIRNLNLAQVERKDWLVYIKDSLKLKGAREIFEKYKIIDSIYYSYDVYNEGRRRKEYLIVYKGK